MNDNINRYLGKASKHGKRVKSKRGKSGKKKKNLFSTRSGSGDKPQPIPSPTLPPSPSSEDNTIAPTPVNTPTVGTSKTLSPTTSLAPTPFFGAVLPDTPGPSPVDCIDDVQCDDGKICTIDQCDDSGQCTHDEFISTRCSAIIGFPIPGFQARGALLETFTGIDGTAVSDLTNNPKYINNKPDERVIIDGSLEAPVKRADNFGARLSTYIYVPASGDYNLYVSSDDASALFLSTDADPANKRMIAYVSGYTNKDNFTAYPSQKSGPIYLEVGNPYYLEALHKEGGGGDHLSIAWKLVDDTTPPRKIQGAYFFLEPPVACFSDSNCMALNSNPCMRGSCNLATTLCEETSLCENEKVDCGGQLFAPSCDKCPVRLDGCSGDCVWSNGSCTEPYCKNIVQPGWPEPSKELEEDTVTTLEDDLHRCPELRNPSYNPYDPISLGQTVCGSLSLWGRRNAEGRRIIEKDIDRFIFTYSGGYLKLKLEFEVDSLASLRLREVFHNRPCDLGFDSPIIREDVSRRSPRRIYVFYTDELEEGDYTIEVSLNSGSTRGLETKSYQLTVSDIFVAKYEKMEGCVESKAGDLNNCLNGNPVDSITIGQPVFGSISTYEVLPDESSQKYTDYDYDDYAFNVPSSGKYKITLSLTGTTFPARLGLFRAAPGGDPCIHERKNLIAEQEVSQNGLVIITDTLIGGPGGPAYGITVDSARGEQTCGDGDYAYQLLIEEDEVNCGSDRFAPSCDECPRRQCEGDCEYDERRDRCRFDSTCFKPGLELREGCVTKPEDDLNGCSDSNAFDVITLGYTVCGQLSSYYYVPSSVYDSRRYASDKDVFRLDLPNGVGKIRIKLELMGGDFDAYIRFERSTAGTCGDSYRAIISPSSISSPGVYEFTADNLDAGDYRIEVSGTKLASKPMECGSGEVYSYKLSVTQIDKTCIRNGSYCGTWFLLNTDTGCYADKTDYNDSTRIGYSVSLSVLFIACLNSFYTTDNLRYPLCYYIGFMLFWEIQILQMCTPNVCCATNGMLLVWALVF